MKKCDFAKPKEPCHAHRRGSSSFKMHDRRKVLAGFDLKKGDVVLDLGCGPGDYAIECARIVGATGLVYALDRQQELLDDLKERAERMGLDNIRAIPRDITLPLPLEDNCTDLCIIITVLHIPGVSDKKGKIFAEVKRILKPGGRLVTIDVKKEDSSFGPPLHMRIAPEEVEASVIRHGFEKTEFTDLGNNYMLSFRMKK